MTVPSVYVAGYDAACRVDYDFAVRYIGHTLIGDPAADEVVAELTARHPSADVHAAIGRALENCRNLPKDVPECLRGFVEQQTEPPEWFDEGLAQEATRGFLRNSDMVLAALVGGAIIEGFATLISKSFRLRGRILDNGVRRLKQNLLHLTEQYMPGGILPGGDGWKLSIRIRLVHAAARRLLHQAPEWDESTNGLPLNAAQMLLASAAFSGRLMQHVQNLGGDFSGDEREGYVHVWRYTGLLLGVPEAILFRDYKSSVRAFEIASLCEPPPDDDAIIMANSIVNSAPIVLGVAESEQRRSMAAYIYQVSRELIGDDVADALMYPPSKRRRELPLLRLRNSGDRMVRKYIPQVGKRRSRSRFMNLLDVSDLGEAGYSYALPTSVFDEDSAPW